LSAGARQENAMPPFNVAVIVGSLRKGSFTRRLAKVLVGMAPETLRCEFVEIGDLPLYNQDPDDEGSPPAAWTAFRQKLSAVDAVLFATPEYNRSMPGVLKNAIDVGSRPYGKSVWDAKPAAIISCAPGAIGGFGANHHLRQAMVFLNMPLMQQPEAYIGHVNDLITEDLAVANEGSRKFLEGFMTSFARWVQTTAKQPVKA
jgi:chromate reductase